MTPGTPLSPISRMYVQRMRWRGPALLLCVLLVPLLCAPAAAALTPEDCLGCHEAYKGYFHAGLTCTDCHSTVKDLPHEEKLPKPACAACHEKTAALYGQSVHGSMKLGCKDCHDPHFLKKGRKQCGSCHSRVAHGTLPAKAVHLKALACVACHAKAQATAMIVSLRFKGRAGVNLRDFNKNGDNMIDRAEWQALVDHLNRSFKGRYAVERLYRVAADPHGVMREPARCDACHGAAGYFGSATLEAGGSEPLKIGIDPRIFIPPLPSREAFEKTAHGKAGVTCADCHGARQAAGGQMGNTVCATCHRDVVEVYGKSMHAKKGATRCLDCHDPHRIRTYKDLQAGERIAVCARCHTDYLSRHSWLPNTPLHFSYLECATCHSPRSEKSMVFYFALKSPNGKARLSNAELVSLAGENPLALMKGADMDLAIGRLFTRLFERDRRVVIDASILVTKVYHDYSETRPKERLCVTCHSRQAGFYDSMFFILPGTDGAVYIPVKGTLLAVYPLGASIDFFLLGQDKIKKGDLGNFAHLRGSPGFKWIDFFGLLLAAATVAGIVVHMVLRLTVKR